MSKDMTYIPAYIRDDGRPVAGHWRKQKPALTAEQKRDTAEQERDKERLALVERARKLQEAREAVKGTEYEWCSDEELLGEE